MMENRWRSTRARLGQEGSRGDAAGLWSRIASSRAAGQVVELPAADPRRRVSPMVLGSLVIAAIAVTVVLRIDTAPAPVAAVPPEDPEVSALLYWLPTPAHAQAVRPSALPPIDPPDVTRLTPRMQVYRHDEGVDGIITGSKGTDTLIISRDNRDARETVAMVYTGQMGPARTMEVIDSLVLASDGRFLFWHYQVSRIGTDRVTRMATTLGTDSVSVTFWRSGGRSAPAPQSWPASISDYVRKPLVAMLPSIPFKEGFARSVSGLDLLRGAMTPGFARSLELRVTGTQSIRVPAGNFRCWTVELTAVYLPGDKPQVSRLWVDMASGSLVRAVWSTYNDFFEDQVLVEQQMPS